MFKFSFLPIFKIRLRMRILICVPQVLMQSLMNLSHCAFLSRGFHLLKLAGNCPMELCLKQEALFCMSQSRLRMTLDATSALQRVWGRMTLQLTSLFVKEVSRNLRFRWNVHHFLAGRHEHSRKIILKFKYNWYFTDKGFLQQHLASSLADQIKPINK